MKRAFKYDILNVIQERWSTKSFINTKISDEEIKAVLEAASYAPSCFNEQPWRYIVASSDEDLKVLQSFLYEDNLIWAKNAPVLMVLLATKTFAYNDKVNSYNQFDTGTAWGFLQLEAWTRGYATHGMAGFSKKKVRQVLKIPETLDIVAMVAMGIIGEERDLPNTRNPVDQIHLDIHAFNKL